MKKILILVIILCLSLISGANIKYESDYIDLSNGTKIIILNSTQETNQTNINFEDKRVEDLAVYYKVDLNKLTRKLSKRINIQVSKNHPLILLEKKYNLTIEESIKIAKNLNKKFLLKIIILIIALFISFLLYKKIKFKNN